MPAAAARTGRAVLWLGGVLLLISLSLRLPVTSVPPILDDLRADTGLSTLGASLLTTAPVVCFGLGATLAPAVVARMGGEATLLICLVATAAGVAVRIVVGDGPLFVGTIVAGLAVAIANVVLPSVIKRDFPRPGAMMGVYSMGISASGALAAGLTVPLEHATGSWRWALAVWALPAVLAAALWLPATLVARRGREAGLRTAVVTLWRDPLAWTVTAMFALHSFLFYATVSWVPTIFRHDGMSASTAGLMLSLALVLGIPSSFAMPILAARARDQRTLVGVVYALWAGGLAALLVAPATLAPLSMALIGIAQGAGLGLMLMLFVLRAPDGAHTAALSGMTQSVGYLVAGTGPFLLGAAHDLTGGWQAPIVLLLADATAFLIAGLAAARPRLVGGTGPTLLE